MATITIPKKLSREEELIAIPRKEYEEYLHLRKVIPIVKMSASEKKAWQRAKKEYSKGKYITL